MEDELKIYIRIRKGCLLSTKSLMFYAVLKLRCAANKSSGVCIQQSWGEQYKLLCRSWNSRYVQ